MSAIVAPAQANLAALESILEDLKLRVVGLTANDAELWRINSQIFALHAAIKAFKATALGVVS